MTTHADSNKRQIIEEALRLIVEEGAAKLSYDRLAERTGLSKGGVLYHFASKQTLLESLIAYSEGAFREHYMTRISECRPAPGRAVRAYLDALDNTYGDDAEMMCAAMSAIMAEHPELLESYRMTYRLVRKDIQEDGGDFARQWSIIVAIDGLCMDDMSGLYEFTKTERAQLMQYFKEQAAIIH